MTLAPISTRLNQAQTLKDQLGLPNIHQAPRLIKISVNVGLGELKGNEPLQKTVMESLALITGQKPVKTVAKKAIAGFKLRQGDIIGYRVTLRGQKMYQFIDRIITYVFPRIRDFQGFSNHGFDGQGNYSFGLKDQMVFPELPYESHTQTWGMQITITTSANSIEQSRALLQQFGFPFTKPKD